MVLQKLMRHQVQSYWVKSNSPSSIRTIAMSGYQHLSLRLEPVRPGSLGGQCSPSPSLMPCMIVNSYCSPLKLCLCIPTYRAVAGQCVKPNGTGLVEKTAPTPTTKTNSAEIWLPFFQTEALWVDPALLTWIVARRNIVTWGYVDVFHLRT